VKKERALFDLSPEEWTAIWLSLRIAVVATLTSLPFGCPPKYAKRESIFCPGFGCRRVRPFIPSSAARLRYEIAMPVQGPM
jgi:hypothetical protein